ncbi:MAG: hypothetical protein HY833_01045 [Candidatus Aenigmarchaeota archaeon]|nr:hypothetical protein [Candidatus Aenigmarchaeota archaeon]
MVKEYVSPLKKKMLDAIDKARKKFAGKSSPSSPAFPSPQPLDYAQDSRGNWTIVKNAGSKMKNAMVNRSPSAATVTLLVVGIFVVASGFMFVTYNATFNSFLENTVGVSWKGLSNQVEDQAKLWDCVIKNSWANRLASGALIDPSSFSQGGGNIDAMAYCQAQFAKAQEVGCSDCFEMSSGGLQFSVPPGPGVEAIVRTVIKATDEKYSQDGEDFAIPSATKVSFYMEDQDGKDAVLDANLNIGEGEQSSSTVLTGSLNPAILYTYPLTIEGKFDVSADCGSKRDKIDADSVLKYSYKTDGQAFINVKKFSTKDTGNAFTKKESITFPGPVKIDMIPDSNLFGGIYSVDLIKKARVEVKFRNTGRGKAVINGVSIKQTPPEGYAPLPITCSGIISGSASDINGEYTIDTEIKLDSNDRSASSITCSFDLAGARDVLGDYPQWRIDGRVSYDYELKAKAGTIQIDKSSCDSVAYGETGSGISTSGAAQDPNGGPDISGLPEGTGIGSDGKQCVLPDELKKCASGSFQEDGCCR